MRRFLGLLLLLTLAHPGWADITTGLQLYYTFDDASGTSIADSSGNGRTGSLAGTASWLTAGSCKTGGCLRFVAANTNVVTQSATVIPTLMTINDGTIAAWVNPHGTPTASSSTTSLPAVFADAAGFVGLFRGNRTVGGDAFHFYNWSGSEHRGQVAYTPDVWVHLAWVHSASSSLIMYKDGVQSGSTVATNTTTAGAGSVLIGKSQTGTNYLEADIDELRVYSRALTAPDVLELFQTGQGGVLNRWRMMELERWDKALTRWLFAGRLR